MAQFLLAGCQCPLADRSPRLVAGLLNEARSSQFVPDLDLRAHLCLLPAAHSARGVG